MASWRKLLRARPMDLGDRHLDDVIEPVDHSQRSNAKTAVGGYPVPGFSAGAMRVSHWSHFDSEQDRVIQDYTTITGRKFTRSLGGASGSPTWKEVS